MSKTYRKKLANDFKREAQRVNSHFERFRKSSLRPVLLILDQINDTAMGAPPLLSNIQQLALQNAIAAIPNNRKIKYAAALKWLAGRIPAIDTSIKLGVTADVGYAPGREERKVDRDGGWHKFFLQEEGNSCGPTCVRTVLLPHTGKTLPSEAEIRNSMGLHETGRAHTGDTVSAHDWANTGSNVPGIVQYLKSQGLRDARSVVGRALVEEELGKATTNNRAIIGWWWGRVNDYSGGGHWTTCVGKTNDELHFKIIDPWNGIQYLPVATFDRYQTTGGANGWFNPDDSTDPAVVVTHPKT